MRHSNNVIADPWHLHHGKLQLRLQRLEWLNFVSSPLGGRKADRSLLADM